MKHDLHDNLGLFVLHTCSGPRVGHAAHYLTYITWRSRAIPIRGEALGCMALLIYEH